MISRKQFTLFLCLETTSRYSLMFHWIAYCVWSLLDLQSVCSSVQDQTNQTKSIPSGHWIQNKIIICPFVPENCQCSAKETIGWSMQVDRHTDLLSRFGQITHNHYQLTNYNSQVYQGFIIQQYSIILDLTLLVANTLTWVLNSDNNVR